jgi:hypothetical protein
MLEPDYWVDGSPHYIDVGAWDGDGMDWRFGTDYIIDEYLI